MQVKGTLQLKVGAQVMLMQRLKGRERLVNGSRGVITRFAGATNPEPIVRFVDVRPCQCSLLVGWCISMVVAQISDGGTCAC